MRTGTIKENIEKLSNLRPFYAFVADKYLNRDDIGIADYDHVHDLLTIEANDYEQELDVCDPDADKFAEMYILKYIDSYNDRNGSQIGMRCVDAIIDSFIYSSRFDESSSYYLEDIEEHIMMMIDYTMVLMG